jgi:hypothetical protein
MRTLPLWLLTITGAMCPGTAAADPIRINQDARIAATDALVGVNRTHRQVQDRQDANDNLSASVSLSIDDVFGQGAATLNSSVSAHRISGAGTILAIATVPPAANIFRSSLTSAISDLILGFDLDTPHRFDFSAVFTATSHVESDADLATQGPIVIFQSPPMSSGEVRETGLLPAGRSALRIFQTVIAGANGLGGSDSQHGQFSFTCDLSDVTPTPEPASIVLLSSGLLGLVGIRRRRSNRGC